MNKAKWIGIDLDGTLAETVTGDRIGRPIPAIAELLLNIHQNGKYKVKIFTARAENSEKVEQIKEWLRFYEFPDLEITNVKDSECVLIIDNIATRVYKDCGVICQSCFAQLMRDFGTDFSQASTSNVEVELL